MKKYWFRITKYNPIYRNEVGHYTADEWTAISNIKKYNISWDEYRKVEQAYVDVITKLLTKFNYNELKVGGLEKSFQWKDFSKLRIRGLWKRWKILFKDIINERQEYLPLNEVSICMRLLLREMYWCFLYWNKIEVKTWYDYYMYVLTSDKNIAKYLKDIKDSILFVEQIDLSFFAKDEDWVEYYNYNEEHFKL